MIGPLEAITVLPVAVVSRPSRSSPQGSAARSVDLELDRARQRRVDRVLRRADPSSVGQEVAQASVVGGRHSRPSLSLEEDQPVVPTQPALEFEELFGGESQVLERSLRLGLQPKERRVALALASRLLVEGSQEQLVDSLGVEAGGGAPREQGFQAVEAQGPSRSQEVSLVGIAGQRVRDPDPRALSRSLDLQAELGAEQRSAAPGRAVPAQEQLAEGLELEDSSVDRGASLGARPKGQLAAEAQL